MLYVGAKGFAGLGKIKAVLSHKKRQLMVHIAAPNRGPVLPRPAFYPSTPGGVARELHDAKTRPILSARKHGVQS